MSPVIPEEARNTPQHAEWLKGAGSFDLSHVGDLPAELIEDVAHDFLRRLIIAAYEHRRLAARELRIDHQRIAHGIESLDKARIRKLALKPFHQRVIQTSKEFQHAVDGRRVGDRVLCIDDRLAHHVRHTGRPQRVGRRSALDRQHHQLAEIRGIGEAANSVDAVLTTPVL